MPADCIGMDMNSTSATDGAPVPLCFAHCEHAAQFPQTALPDLPPVALIALFEIPRLDIDVSMRPGVFVSYPFLFLTEGSPPLRIQYQVFRI